MEGGLPRTSLAIFADFSQVYGQVLRKRQKRRLLLVGGERVDALCCAGEMSFWSVVVVGEGVLGRRRCLSLGVQVGRVGKKGSHLSGFGRDPTLGQGQLGRQGCRVKVGTPGIFGRAQ